MNTMQDVVQAGVDAHTQIDKHLAKAYEFAKTLTSVTERGVELGMTRGINAKRIIGEARALQGGVGDLAAAFAVLHQQQTDICKENGVDLGNVTTAGGITIGGAQPLSGGR